MKVGMKLQYFLYYLLMSVLGFTCFLTSVNSELSGEQVGSRWKSTVLVLDEIVIVSIETAERRELEWRTKIGRDTKRGNGLRVC